MKRQCPSPLLLEGRRDVNGKPGDPARPLKYEILGGHGDEEAQGQMAKGGPGLGRDEIDVEIRCPVHSRALSLLRCFAKSVAADVGFTDSEIDQIEMAVDEACANVVCHAYKHLGISPDIDDVCRNPAPGIDESGGADPQCMIVMRVSLRGDCLRFQIIDFGIGLHRSERKGVSSLDEYLERGGRGGLGTFIMSHFMDEVEYEFPEDRGTIVTMTKYMRSS